jgi:hypothetical protein
MVNRYSFLIILLILLGCSKQNKATKPEIGTKEYDIYSMIVGSFNDYNAPKEFKKTVLFVHYNTVFPEEWNNFESIPFEVTKNNYPKFIDSLNKSKIKRDSLMGWISDENVFAHLQKIFPTYDWKYIKHNFDSVNSKIYSIDSQKIKCSIPVKLVSRSEMYKSCEEDTSPLKQKCLWTQFSRVGFDPSGNIAVVYYNQVLLGGGGKEYNVLKRVDNKWIILHILRQLSV